MTDPTNTTETDSETTTKSNRVRWDYTGTVAALLLVATSCAITALYAYRGAKVPVWLATTFTLTALTAAAWAFGESALRAARKARGGE